MIEDRALRKPAKLYLMHSFFRNGKKVLMALALGIIKKKAGFNL